MYIYTHIYIYIYREREIDRFKPEGEIWKIKFVCKKSSPFWLRLLGNRFW